MSNASLCVVLVSCPQQMSLDAFIHELRQIRKQYGGTLEVKTGEIIKTEAQIEYVSANQYVGQPYIEIKP